MSTNGKVIDIIANTRSYDIISHNIKHLSIDDFPVGTYKRLAILMKKWLRTVLMPYSFIVEFYFSIADHAGEYLPLKICKMRTRPQKKGFCRIYIATFLKISSQSSMFLILDPYL